MSLMLIAWTVTMNKMKTSAGENQQWIDTKISSDLKKKEIYTHAFIPLSFYHNIMANIIFTIIITIFMLIIIMIIYFPPGFAGRDRAWGEQHLRNCSGNFLWSQPLEVGDDHNHRHDHYYDHDDDYDICSGHLLFNKTILRLVGCAEDDKMILQLK